MLHHVVQDDWRVLINAFKNSFFVLLIENARTTAIFLRFSKILLGSLSLILFSPFLCCTNVNPKPFCSSCHAQTLLKQQLEEPRFVLIRIACIVSLHWCFPLITSLPGFTSISIYIASITFSLSRGSWAKYCVWELNASRRNWASSTI